MRKRLSVLMSILVAAVLTLAACSGGGSKKDDSGGKGGVKSEKSENVLNLSSGSDIPTMDSSLATDQVSFFTFNQTLEGLYVLNKDDEPEPGVAKGDPEKSDDGKTWTIKLRDDAKWSNGDPVTAHDFVYAWQRTVDPDTAAEYAYMFENIENASEITSGKKKPEELGVKAIDDQTLEVKLVKDVPWMQSLFAFGSFMPQNEKFVEKQGKKFGTTADTTLSNGPFKMTQWKTEDNWKLEPNDKYWDKDKVKLKEVNYKVVKETQTAINLYQTGKLDSVTLDATNVSKYKDREDFSTELNSSNFFYRINKTKNKDLENEDLRKAFAKSIDKKKYVNSLLNDGSVPSDKLMVKDFVKDEDGKDYIDGVKSPLNYDKEEAKKLLEKAKKETGKDKFNIELLTYDQDVSKKAAEFVKEQVEQNLPGVTLKIKQQPFKQKLELESKGDYDISFAGWGPDYPDPTTFLDLFKKDSPHNQTGYSNAEYDKALKEANTDEMLKEENSEKRTKMLQDAESKFLESASIGPLYQQGVARLRQPYVKNWQPHKFGGDYSLKEVEIAGSK
ncbi:MULTISPECIES: peptide ABC transporter substrate-binding protein [Mammaliicoccus]|uniref:Peptide ABC transporter substrate-binding protein n=1 Tax=Mammaliicoccus lentus TaxID=42858 RepID=A0ABS6GU74_MAMLE|nr:peptide ABC transporter substrate-binding protein [Mammaliicoccus lentus]MBF0795603.1 peptide ABC transporter substrate-binding protein [Mammaliicoccus lentus]MBU6112934.1 peptide ABC transporter substrate-binding protein [Mammaliicoccus lentus]OAO30957.1 peptide ABC transporter substrate-binding protein [Mammaliicoccus lentus]QMU10517.1 peptide ABC transporter substrate-binding protein [Mammaliicoccus lentus]TFV13864.1 peptide ABC transporter substrate-binding protein [Mammaliicoccus lentu